VFLYLSFWFPELKQLTAASLLLFVLFVIAFVAFCLSIFCRFSSGYSLFCWRRVIKVSADRSLVARCNKLLMPASHPSKADFGGRSVSVEGKVWVRPLVNTLAQFKFHAFFINAKKEATTRLGSSITQRQRRERFYRGWPR